MTRQIEILQDKKLIGYVDELVFHPKEEIKPWIKDNSSFVRLENVQIQYDHSKLIDPNKYIFVDIYILENGIEKEQFKNVLLLSPYSDWYGEGVCATEVVYGRLDLEKEKDSENHQISMGCSIKEEQCSICSNKPFIVVSPQNSGIAQLNNFGYILATDKNDAKIKGNKLFGYKENSNYIEIYELNKDITPGWSYFT